MNKLLLIGSPIYSYILNILFLFYAGLLPFSNAFDIHTGPYLIFLFWLLEGDLSNKLKTITTNKATLFLSIFFILSIASLGWSNNLDKGYKEIEYYFALFSIFIAMLTSLKRAFIKPIIYTFLLSMFISEIYSYGIFFEIFTPKGANPNNPSPPYIHHLRYSIFLAVTAIILLSRVLEEQIKSLRVFEGLFFISTTANLFLNGGRTGQLAFLVALSIFLIDRYGFRLKTVLSATLLIATIVIVAYNLSPIFQKRANLAIKDTKSILNNNLQNSWGERVAMKIVATHMILKHPLTGEGIGDAMDSYKRALNSPTLKQYYFTNHVPHVHDQYMQIAIQSGLISMGVFILFLIFVWNIECSSIINKATLHAILSIFIIGFFTDVLLRNYISGLFGFILALLIIKCKKE